ncbi:DEAD/DEAH box helicase [Sansalvadorimonas sp. 2012CJ34-2]|uniref:DEAD/DEAH box helicase n=1 Tax=Parendozoicomonas callyspongiae TaxID=2942213 RepID=A0ABT0PBB3_9GAMM|nr:DEAD/DEAH box helicase [Sansalvadorimonas sp. 2012CJ34-2]MCL6268669.1 DEAD/DEAH box helicase [Sansalvadorimonas sp. 2012CJ34-2]
MTDFSSLGLSEPLLTAVEEAGYKKPTPVQAKAIPMVLTGRDIMASAQTGTGKTAGFTLPLLHRLSEMRASQDIRALVLVPTRELALQVGESFATYGKHLPLNAVTVFGGVDMAPQIEALEAGADILIATPGRLLDLISKEHVSLGKLRILVLDEADRMLDLGFKDDIDRILQGVPAKRQSLLFSATFSPEIKQLASEFQRHPVKVEVSSQNSAAKTVQQSVYPVDHHDKPEILSYIIHGGRWNKALVFVRTKKSANKVAELLVQDGIQARAIHSDKSQHLRTRTLDDFKRNRFQVLVATDVAARGLDIEQLPLVVNYDLPKVAQDYVHRIGRSGRAGTAGCAITLMSPEERKLMDGIRQLVKQSLKVEPVPYFENGEVRPVESYEQPQKEKPKPSRKGKNHRGKSSTRKSPAGKHKNKRTKTRS